MIYIKNRPWLFTICMLLAGVLGLSSCDKEEVGSPVISQVRLLNPTKKDSVFKQAYPGTLILIEGSNLSGVSSVYFNGLSATFNPVYNTEGNLIVTIPANTPTEATQSTVSNTIRLVTNHGETTYNFVLLPPPPTIYSIYNENTLAGSKMKIIGSDLYLVQKVVFPGKIDVTDLTASSDGKQILVTVPANISAAGSITVVTKFGTTTSAGSVNLYTGSTVGCNFDDINTYQWGCKTSADAVAFPGGRGNYAQIQTSGVGAGNSAWYDGSRSINMGDMQWVPKASLNDAISNYALKFEIYVKEKWNAGTIFIDKDYSFKYMARFEPWKQGTSVVDFTTEGWYTVTIPLTEFRTKLNGDDGTGDSAPSLTALLGSEGKGVMNVYFMNPGTATVEVFNTAFDNFRVVKIK